MVEWELEVDFLWGRFSLGSVGIQSVSKRHGSNSPAFGSAASQIMALFASLQLVPWTWRTWFPAHPPPRRTPGRQYSIKSSSSHHATNKPVTIFQLWWYTSLRMFMMRLSSLRHQYTSYFQSITNNINQGTLDVASKVPPAQPAAARMARWFFQTRQGAQRTPSGARTYKNMCLDPQDTLENCVLRKNHSFCCHFLRLFGGSG